MLSLCSRDCASGSRDRSSSGSSAKWRSAPVLRRRSHPQMRFGVHPRCGKALAALVPTSRARRTRRGGRALRSVRALRWFLLPRARLCSRGQVLLLVQSQLLFGSSLFLLRDQLLYLRLLRALLGSVLVRRLHFGRSSVCVGCRCTEDYRAIGRQVDVAPQLAFRHLVFQPFELVPDLHGLWSPRGVLDLIGNSLMLVRLSVLFRRCWTHQETLPTLAWRPFEVNLDRVGFVRSENLAVVAPRCLSWGRRRLAASVACG